MSIPLKSLLITIGITLGAISAFLSGLSVQTQPKPVSAELLLGGNLNSTVYEQGTIKLISLINATTTASSTSAVMSGGVQAGATSTPINIGGAKKVTWIFAQNTATGTSNFKVEVSEQTTDTGAFSTNFLIYKNLIQNVVNSNLITRVSSTTLSSAATTTLSMNLENDTFQLARCIVNNAGSLTSIATSSCLAIVER